MKAEDLKNLNIAVIGAGYGGAAAAKALSLLGATVNVYEQASQMREVGAGIGLRPATMARFRQWGIFDAIAAVSSPSDYFEILSATGHPIMKDTWPEHGDQKQTHLIHRGDFIDALLGVLPEGMVHLGHKLEGIEDKGDRSVLTFTNGKTIEADLVVGADGIKSVVREQLFSKAGPVFSGEHAYRAVISADDAHGMVVDDNLRMYIGKGTKVYLLPLRHRNQMSFDITALNPDGTWAPTITTENLVATVEGFDERIVSNPNVSCIHRPDNGGPVEAFNDGARVATGEFLVRLDADDMLTPGSLGRATLVAQAFPSVGLVYGHPLHFSKLQLPSPRVRPTAWTVWPGREWLTDRCRSGKNVITSPEVLMRRSLLERYGYLSPLAHSHDMELWLRLSAFSDVAYIHGADQAWHREHAKSLSATHVDDVVDFRERVAAFRVLFEGPAGAHPDSTNLYALARRSLAKEALWKTRHELARGIQFSSLRTTWLDLSAAMDPAIISSPEWNRLHLQPAEWFLPPLLRPRAVALRLRGRIKSDLAWHRWHRTGVF